MAGCGRGVDYIYFTRQKLILAQDYETEITAAFVLYVDGCTPRNNVS